MANGKKVTKMFSSEEVAAFCQQIAIMLNGGIPLYEASYILCNEIEDKQTKEILLRMDRQVKCNMPFYLALEQTGAFPVYMVHMVRIGEMTGKLEEVMKSLSRYYERDSNVKAGIRSVITYPLMLFAMMVVILLILVIKILPMFQTVFYELNADTAVSGKNRMEFGIYAGKCVALIAICFFALVIGLLLWYRTNSGKKRLLGVARSVFLTKGMCEKMATAKFVSSMALMISSGIESKEAMEMAKTVVEHPKLNHKIQNSINLISSGAPFGEALKESKIIEGIQGRMIQIGVKTGAADAVFAKISEQYDSEIENMLNSVSSIIETILVVILSVIVGSILISVMLPLVSIISSVG
jgi:Type II secretory pathway, component PulF